MPGIISFILQGNLRNKYYYYRDEETEALRSNLFNNKQLFEFKLLCPIVLSFLKIASISLDAKSEVLNKISMTDILMVTSAVGVLFPLNCYSRECLTSSICS